LYLNKLLININYIKMSMEQKAPNTKNLSVKEIFNKSAKSGLSGGAAMLVQVTTLMWMRTIMNYQYRYP
jgi:hypothetical protein